MIIDNISLQPGILCLVSNYMNCKCSSAIFEHNADLFIFIGKKTAHKHVPPNMARILKDEENKELVKIQNTNFFISLL